MLPFFSNVPYMHAVFFRWIASSITFPPVLSLPIFSCYKFSGIYGTLHIHFSTFIRNIPKSTGYLMRDKSRAFSILLFEFQKKKETKNVSILLYDTQCRPTVEVYSTLLFYIDFFYVYRSNIYNHHFLLQQPNQNGHLAHNIHTACIMIGGAMYTYIYTMQIDI